MVLMINMNSSSFSILSRHLYTDNTGEEIDTQAAQFLFTSNLAIFLASFKLLVVVITRINSFGLLLGFSRLLILIFGRDLL